MCTDLYLLIFKCVVYCLIVFLTVCYSLSAISDVLTALAEHRNHIPYRNSTLTYLLKESIGMLMLLKLVIYVCYFDTWIDCH